MKFTLPAWFQVLAISLVSVVLAGCASAPATSEAQSRAAPVHGATSEKSLVADLRKGMTPEQVRQALGDPAEVRPLDTREGRAETWIYRRPAGQVVNQKATHTQDVPYVDPITGQMRMIPEPAYSLETTQITEEAHLVWLDGRLVNWSAFLRGDRSYTR